MTNFVEKDKTRRKLVYKYESKRLEYNAIIKDCTLPKEVRYYYTQELNKLPRNSSLTRIRNRCIVTGRGRGVYRFCKLSRIIIRQLAAQGLLNGVKKSSW